MNDTPLGDERWEQLHRERVRLQTQIDRIAGRVEEVERVMQTIVQTSHDPAVFMALAKNHAPTPPPDPAPAQDAPEMFDDPTADDIGRWAKRRRQLRGMTLRDVSDATGIAYSHIAKFENGGSNISADYLFAICKAVGGAAGLMLPGYAGADTPGDGEQS